MSEPGHASKAFEAPAILIVVAVVAAVADFAAVYQLLNSETVLSWLGGNARLTVVVGGILILILAGLLYAWLRARSIAGGLVKRVAQLEDRPSEQDRRRYEEFWNDFGLESNLYKYLKLRFLPHRVGYRDLSAMDAVVGKWENDPTSYHNSLLRSSFQGLRDALLRLHETMNEHYFTIGGVSTAEKTRFGVPPEWEDNDPGRWKKAINDLNEGRQNVMRRYDTFLNDAHSVKVTER